MFLAAAVMEAPEDCMAHRFLRTCGCLHGSDAWRALQHVDLQAMIATADEINCRNMLQGMHARGMSCRAFARAKFSARVQ